MFYIEEETEVPIIHAREFLPRETVEGLYSLFDEFRPKFGDPSWASIKGEELEAGNRKRSLCAGQDIWFPLLDETVGGTPSAVVPPLLYDLVENYLFHQGLIEFCAKARNEVFRLLSCQSPDGRFHLISYGNGDYYNWHRDSLIGEGPLIYGSSPTRNNLFTLSLTFGKSTSMEGGDLLFMRDGKCVRRPFEHNTLCIFPSTVFHAASPIKLPEEKSWLDRRFSLQFWLAGSQVLSRRERSDLRISK